MPDDLAISPHVGVSTIATARCRPLRTFARHPNHLISEGPLPDFLGDLLLHAPGDSIDGPAKRLRRQLGDAFCQPTPRRTLPGEACVASASDERAR